MDEIRVLTSCDAHPGPSIGIGMVMNGDDPPLLLILWRRQATSRRLQMNAKAKRNQEENYKVTLLLQHSTADPSQAVWVMGMKVERRRMR